MTQEQETPTEEVVVEEPKPPTVEELQTELASAKENSTKFESNWKDAQRVSSKKDTENQRLREQLTGNESQSDMNKVLVAMIASQRNQPTEELAEEIKAQQPDLLKQYEQIVEASEKKRQLDHAVSLIKTVQERTEALGLQGDDYEIVRALAEAGQFDKAEKRLDKLEEAKQTKPPEPKESDDEKVERLANEKLQAELKERGLLTQDTGSPSASGSLSGMGAGDIKEKMKDPAWFKEHESEVDDLYKSGKFFNK